MTLLLVRHADAGSRSAWLDDDRLRPLSDRGHRQAMGLVRLLGDRWLPARLVSSPSVRCINTLSPLSAVIEVAVDIEAALAEGADSQGAVALVRDLADREGVSVVCTHGDVLPAVLEVLHDEDGLDIGRGNAQKGATFVLTRKGHRFRSAEYLEPTA